jgi:hypothetical protein
VEALKATVIEANRMISRPHPLDVPSKPDSFLFHPISSLLTRARAHIDVDLYRATTPLNLQKDSQLSKCNIS